MLAKFVATDQQLDALIERLRKLLAAKKRVDGVGPSGPVLPGYDGSMPPWALESWLASNPMDVPGVHPTPEGPGG